MNSMVKISKQVIFLSFLLICLLQITACSNSSIASVEEMSLTIGGINPPPYHINVLLKPQNAQPNVSYVVRLYEGDLLVDTSSVSWTQETLLAHRACEISFPFDTFPPALQGTDWADVSKYYHVTISKP